MTLSERSLPHYATCTADEAARYAELTAKGYWALCPSELTWRDRCEYLEQHGYLLRPRYQPDWVPSWLGTLRAPEFCEDSVCSRNYRVIDATRQRDGQLVSIKVVSSQTSEIDIARALGSDQLLQDPRNHCVPILDVLPDPLDSTRSLLIMPYLRPFDKPAFTAVGEVLDFMQQTLEGLKFIHDQGVAHRDCAAANIMMDGRPLYPLGHHPSRTEYTPDALNMAPHVSRIDAPVRYYFIDFGISSAFSEDQSPLVTGTKGRDDRPPELSNHVPYDPFKLDVCILGYLYYDMFINTYQDLEYLSPLVAAMVHDDPSQRPTAAEALAMFEKIVGEAALTPAVLRWRLRQKSETAPLRIAYDTVAVAKEGLFQARRLVALCTF